MSKEVKQSTVSSAFKQAVEKTPDIAKGYNAGLQALGTNASKIQVAEPRLLEGSVDIDACTKEPYPSANRWDYVFSYKEKTYFVEVHPAFTSEVAIVIQKYDWLLQWLKNNAPEIDGLPKATPAFHWIQTNGCHIPRTARQYRSIVQRGLKPCSGLKL